MAQPSVLVDKRQSTLPRMVSLDRPWAWLAAGWSDMQRAPGISLAYGLLFTLIGLLLTISLWAVGWIYLTLPMAAGFLIVGPILAVGLYDVSRRLQTGEPVTLIGALSAWKRNGTQIGLMGLVLLLLMVAWLRLAALIFMLFFGLEPPALDQLVQETLLSNTSLPFLIVGGLTGAALAAFTFAISVISIPLLLDRPDANVMAAMVTSVQAVGTNIGPLFFWGALIVLFIGAGLMTFFLGLVVTLPLIAHASWHAYKDLMSEPGLSSARRISR